MRLKLRQPDMHPNSVRVWLGDVEITHDLLSVTVEWAADDITVATVRIAPGEVDIDTESAANLVAIASSSKEESQR